MRRALPLLPLISFAAGCGASLDAGPARAALEAAAAAANPAGRTGLLLQGHNVWLGTDAFDKSCLESKDLAFNDDPSRRPDGSGPRISPTYAAQIWITARTNKGYCVVLGEDPAVELGEPSWSGEGWRIQAKYTVSKPSPWFECLNPDLKDRLVEVRIPDGGPPEIARDLSLGQGDCPSPVPAPGPRAGAAPPTARPKGPPSRAEVIELVTAFDALLAKNDHAAALQRVSCWNLFEEQKYGSCVIGDLVAVGPQFPSEPSPGHGTPWLEYAVASAEDIGKITMDGKDPTLAHVLVKHKRTGADRSFSVQWVEGAWKLHGVLNQKAEALSALRFLNDLHQREAADVHRRRIAGEAIDHRGQPLEGAAPAEG
jgi:hypothetical protein